jgi:orotidine-5'-phosphate decarboxylase
MQNEMVERAAAGQRQPRRRRAPLRSGDDLGLGRRGSRRALSIRLVEPMAQELRVQTEFATAAFSDRLAAAVERKRSQLCVGLDPRVDLFPVELRGEAPAEAVARFCRGVVDAVAPYAVAVKPQLAFFEALGADGMRAFEEVCAYARTAELLVIVDGKRGDIGSTARGYAAGYLEPRGNAAPLGDALTVNPYLGRDSMDPLLAACRRHAAGLFVLVKTSNAGSADVQDLTLSDGRTVWMQVAALVDEWGEELLGENGLSSVGAVVGATFPREVGDARRLMPRSIILLPGVGEQGGTPADVARAFASGPASALVSASRSVIYAYRSGSSDWRAAAGAEAARLRAAVWAVSGW